MNQRVRGGWWSRLDTRMWLLHDSGDHEDLDSNSHRDSPRHRRLLKDSSLYVGSDSLVLALRSLVNEVRANPRKLFNLKVF